MIEFQNSFGDWVSAATYWLQKNMEICLNYYLDNNHYLLIYDSKDMFKNVLLSLYLSWCHRFRSWWNGSKYKMPNISKTWNYPKISKKFSNYSGKTIFYLKWIFYFSNFVFWVVSSLNMYENLKISVGYKSKSGQLGLLEMKSKCALSPPDIFTIVVMV